MPAKRKLAYKITNWKKYNESLVARGSVTLWFSDDVLAAWRAKHDATKVGRPFVYSDAAIECLLTIRELFQLPYRQTEGFGRSLLTLLAVEVAVPDYSSLAKRAGRLAAKLAATHHRGAVDVVVDSTGLKVFGEGEWKTRIYGPSKRRTWRKLHLAVNPDTREIVAELLAESSGHDADQVAALCDQIPQPIGKFYGDGAYDKWKAYDQLHGRPRRAGHPAAA